MVRLRWTLPALIASCAVFASSQMKRSIPERARASDRVVLADVLSARVELPDGNPRHMMTLTTLVVRERYKGGGPDRIEVRQLGGKSGLWETHVAGDAVPRPGETAILFLHCTDATAPERCSMVGLGQGKLGVERGGAGFEAQVDGARRPLESIVDDIRRGGPWAGRPINRGAK
jgi:hypothetical protein